MDTSYTFFAIAIAITICIGVIGYNHVMTQPAIECAKAGNEFTINMNGSMTCKKPS